jgi:chromosome partitioning protein
LGDVSFDEAVQRAPQGDLDIVPSNSDLTAAEVGLMEAPLKEKRLSLALAPARERYDFIIIDCPPSLNMLTVNALIAADGVLIPIQCEYYALEGLSALLTTIHKIQASFNRGLQIEGILRTMHDVRNNLANEVSAQLITHFSDQVYRTVIPRNVRLAEAPSHGQPALQYDRLSRGAVSYLALASEVLRRNEQRQAVGA